MQDICISCKNVLGCDERHPGVCECSDFSPMEETDVTSDETREFIYSIARMGKRSRRIELMEMYEDQKALLTQIYTLANLVSKDILARHCIRMMIAHADEPAPFVSEKYRHDCDQVSDALGLSFTQIENWMIEMHCLYEKVVEDIFAVDPHPKSHHVIGKLVETFLGIPQPKRVLFMEAVLSQMLMELVTRG